MRKHFRLIAVALAAILALSMLVGCSQPEDTALPKLDAPAVSINSDGVAEWNKVNDAIYYIYVIGDGEEQLTLDRRVSLKENETIKVKAVSGSEKCGDSEFSFRKTFIKGSSPDDPPDDPPVVDPPVVDPPVVDPPVVDPPVVDPPVVDPPVEDHPLSADAKAYYSKMTQTRGDALLGALHDLITTTHSRYTSYDDCRDTKYIYETDPGPNGGALEFYTQKSIMSFSGNLGNWNREHVWCQSLSNGLWGKSGGGSDMHHIRPSESGLNSTRGNNKFGYVSGGKEAWSRNSSGSNVALGGHVGGGTFEPLDNVKGDVARIVMYVYTHYNKYQNVNGTTNGSKGSSSYFGTLRFTHVVTAGSEAAAIEMLLKWNREDPVDKIEIARNEAVYKIQGNRNPFIDHPEYAQAIWG